MYFAVFRDRNVYELPKAIDRRIDKIYTDLVKEHGSLMQEYLLENATKETDSLKERLTVMEQQASYLQDIVDQVNGEIICDYYDVPKIKATQINLIAEGKDLLITYLAYSKIEGLTTAFKRLHETGLNI
ncbi:MAG: hypothetical protein EOP34_11115 [Rickettsiales bacterium]|nr:MAG: hypothetical protein EOP34_11115 [Rickettsiales bacterium]